MKIVFWSFSKKVIRHLSLMTFFMLPLALSEAQTYFFEKYGVEQGLSSSKVYNIIQDKNDWIWLATESGVSRFDGSGFINFTAADGTAGGGVFSVAEDTLGRIWLGHLNGGLTVFDGKKFFRVKIDTIPLNGDITGIKQIGRHLWITSAKDGAIRINFPHPGDTVLTGRQYGGKDGLGDVISSSYIDNKNTFYCILPNGGIKVYDPEKDQFETFKPKGLTDYFAVVTIFKDSRGDYWFGTHKGGLYRSISKTGEMKVYDVRDGLANNFVSYITEDYRGNVWIGTWGGGITLFYDEKLRTYNKSNGLEAVTVHCMTEDREKNMIIADHFTGISIFKGDHFTTITDPQIIQDKQVYAIGEDPQGKFWIGTNAGISVYNPSATGKNPEKVFNEKSNALINARFIKLDKTGSLWIGTYTRGLFRYDLNAGKMYFDAYLNLDRLERQGVITALEIDDRNRVWIGNYDRLVVYDQEKDTVLTFTQADGLAGTSIKALFCDKDNNIWVGSEEKTGLTKYDSRTGKFKVIRTGEGLVPQVIAQTNDSKIWVGTGGGLLEIQNDSVVAAITEKDGLLSNNIKILQKQGDKFLYIGTNFGLNRLNLSDRSIATFTKRNGFTGIESSPNASITDSKGNLWFGTANGVTKLNPALMPPPDTKPKVHISSMKVNYSQKEMISDLKLNYKEKTILFDFYSVSLSEPDAVKYKVMLEGFEDWKPASDLTQRDYSLSPGHYTFRVMASNSYGYWNEAPVEYSFTIKPPFYKTPLFIVTCLILAVVGIIAYIQIRERNLIREKRILEQKVEERTAEVVQKSREIEEKNRDITASIRYAERIQRAMLPRDDCFHNTFVLYMPKDIVSGDFYWMYDNGDEQFIAACDCTGHGVPGAFMSIIGHNSLNKVVREYGITRPGSILDQLNAEVVKALTQRKEETINDGMDLTLIVFNRKKFTLNFAGAYNPLYLVRKGEIQTYKGDRFPIGMSSLEAKKIFQNQEIEVQPGDMLYMCSDGYADQFGSPEAKKFKSGNVKKLLSDIWNLSICEQRDRLQKEILDWKGDLPQVDDIMFIGTRIPER